MYTVHCSCTVHIVIYYNIIQLKAIHCSYASRLLTFVLYNPRRIFEEAKRLIGDSLSFFSLPVVNQAEKGRGLWPPMGVSLRRLPSRLPIISLYIVIEGCKAVTLELQKKGIMLNTRENNLRVIVFLHIFSIG